MAESSQPADLQALLADGHWARLLARNLVRDEHLAEDVVQSAWLAALERPPPRGVEGRPWFAGVVKNLARMAIRSKVRRQRQERMAKEADAAPLVVELAGRAEMHRTLATFVLDLEEPYRSVCLLRFFGDLTPEQIAGKLGEPAGTIRSRLKRALDKLRERLERTKGRDWRLGLLPILRWTPESAPTSAASVFVGARLAGILFVLAGAGAGIWWWTGGSADRPPLALPGGGADDIAGAALPKRDPGPDSAAARAGIALAPESAAILRGRVVDAGGEPVSGARVFAVARGAPEIARISGDDTAANVAGSAVTDPSGRFEIRPSPDDSLYTLAATARGHAPAIRDSQRCGSDRDIELRLGAPASLAGRVRDAGGDVIPGARLRWAAIVAGIELERGAVSGDDGSFRLDGLRVHDRASTSAAGTVQRLTVTAEGHAARRWRLAPDGLVRPAPLDLVLHRGVTIRGEVVDASGGGPVPAALVGYWPDRAVRIVAGPCGRSIYDPEPSDQWHETRTDAQGRFTIEHCGGAEEHLDASDSGRAPRITGIVAASAAGFAAEFRPVLLDEANGEASVILALHRGATVRGLVTDAVGGPVQGIRVWCSPRYADHQCLPPPFTSARGVAITAVDGTYVFDGIRCGPEGSLDCEVLAHRPHSVHRWTVGRRVVARAGETVFAAGIPLPAANPLTVTVTDAVDGRPVPGAAVSVMPFWLPQDFEDEPATTGRDGRAVLSCPDDGSQARPIRFRVYASAPGHARGSSEEFEVGPATPREITIRLPRGNSIRGSVLEPDGTPSRVWRLLVLDGSVPLGPSLDPAAEMSVTFRGLSDRYLAVLDDGGLAGFAFDDLPPGPWHLVARSTSGIRVRTALLENVGPGQDEVVLRFQEPEPVVEPGTLDVAVVQQAGGAPVLDALAVLTGPEFSMRPIDAAHGIHRFSAVPPGPWILEVQGKGFLRYRKEVTVSAETVPPVVAALERGVVLEGRLEIEAGPPFSYPRISFSSLEGALAQSAPLRDDHSFVVGGLVPGSAYQVAIRDETAVGTVCYAPRESRPVVIPRGRDRVPMTLPVVAGCLTQILLPRERERRQRLEFFLPDGTRVWWMKEPPASFRVGFGPGEYRVVLGRDGAAPVERRVVLSGGSKHTIDLGGS